MLGGIHQGLNCHPIYKFPIKNYDWKRFENLSPNSKISSNFKFFFVLRSFNCHQIFVTAFLFPDYISPKGVTITQRTLSVYGEKESFLWVATRFTEMVRQAAHVVDAGTSKKKKNLNYIKIFVARTLTSPTLASPKKRHSPPGDINLSSWIIEVRHFLRIWCSLYPSVGQTSIYWIVM